MVGLADDVTSVGRAGILGIGAGTASGLTIASGVSDGVAEGLTALEEHFKKDADLEIEKDEYE